MNVMFKAECNAVHNGHGTSIDALLMKMIRMPRSTVIEFDAPDGRIYQFKAAGISVNFELWAQCPGRAWTEIGFYSDH